MNQNNNSLPNNNVGAGGIRRTTARMFNRNRANNNGAGTRPSPIAVPQRLNNNGVAGQLVMSPFQGPPASPPYAPASPFGPRENLVLAGSVLVPTGLLPGAQVADPGEPNEFNLPEENIVPPNNGVNGNNGNAPGVASAPAPRGGIRRHRKHKKRTHKKKIHKKRTYRRKH